MRLIGLVAILLLMLPGPQKGLGAEIDEVTIWIAGAYSFSDELGGFSIMSASGTGTRTDPIRIVQQQTSATPVTLVIRAVRQINPFARAGDYGNGFMHMRIETINASGIPWVAFEFELQENLAEPSVYGDGLSFDQRRVSTGAVMSDRFAHFDGMFEPYDRLRFSDGYVDPHERASFGFLITDFTPRDVFYLLQDPRIPAS